MKISGTINVPIVKRPSQGEEIFGGISKPFIITLGTENCQIATV
jgi:hypothetical protein